MACRVEYNEEDKILKVTKRDGKESSLFRKLAKHPAIENLEEALEVYKNTESTKMYQKEENYMVANRVGDEIFGSYKDALQSSPSKVEVGFLDNSGNFLPFKVIEPSYDTTTEKGFINFYIREGLMSEEKVINQGETYFQAGGLTQEAQGIKDDMLRQKALAELGWMKYKKSLNGYQFGEHVAQDKGSTAGQILAEELRNILNVQTSNFEEGSNLNENELKLRLLDLLNAMGVTVTSITDYVDKYKIKNGVEPSATALADIANKVVAFKDGKIALEELTEEVAHFIVEGWNQEEIQNILRNIHQTKEYQEFAERYREIYGKKFKGEELETAVRKEILGKVLANSMKNNFNTENKTGVVTSIINKVKELFDKLLNYIGLNTTQQLKQDLNRFTEQVQDLVYTQQLNKYINTNNYQNSQYVMYAVGKEKGQIKGLRAEVEKGLEALKRSINNLDLKNKAAGLKAKRALEKLQELTAEQDTMLQKQAAVEMAAVADSQINYLNNLIKDSKNNDKVTFGANETAAFQTLTQNVDPLITSIRANIKDKPELYPPKEWDKVAKQLEEVQNRIADLKTNAKNIYEGTIEDLITKVILKNEKLDESYRDHVRQWMQAAHKDSTLFHRYFGQVVNSKDPLLGLLSDVIERTMNGGRQEYVASIKTFLKTLEDEVGMKPEELKQFFDNGFLLDEIDHAKVEETVLRISAEIRKEVTGDTQSVEDIMKMLESKEDIPTLTAEQSAQYSRIFKTRIREIQQTFFNDAYYEQLDRKYEELGINSVTKNTISAYSSARSQLLSEAVSSEGIVDWSKLSKADYEFLKEQKRMRKADKDFYTEDGALKNGLTQVDSIQDVPSQYLDAQGNLLEQAAVFEEDGLYFFVDPAKVNDRLSTDGLVSIDLHKLDKRYTEDQEGREQTVNLDKFLTELSRIEKEKGEEAAQKFLETNASIMLSRNFWDNMGTEQSFIERIEEGIANTPEDLGRESLESELRALKINISRRRNLLNRHKNPNKPFEIEKVHRSVRETIKELDEEISKGYSTLSKVVEEQESTEEMDRNFEISVNEAYNNEVADRELTIKEEIEFLYQNSSRKANDRVSNFRYNLESEAKGFAQGLTERQKQFIEEGNYDINDPDSRLEAVRDFAKTQVASYYKRLAPKEIDAQLSKKETESYVEYVKRLEANENLQITPNYSFMEDVMSEFKNPDFDANYEGGVQVKKQATRTVPVFDNNGKVVGYESQNINFESQRYKDEVLGNTQKMAALGAIKTLQRQTLANYGLTGRHNLYKLPQINKKGIDRFVDMARRVGRGGLKQGLEEMFSYRVDDLEYGETVGSTNVAVVPTYYTRDVANKEELTDELFFSYAAMHQQSILHKHRKNNISEALALKEAIESRAASGAGASTKNTVGMFNNYFDYAFFGKNESQEYKVTIMGQKYDVTKAARKFLDFIKLRNLGFSAIVGATSYFTSEINFQIEKFVGEFVNKDSLRLGSKEWAKLAKDSISETGQIRSKSKLNILGEYFGIFQSEERFKNTNYGYFARNFSKLPFSVHAMGNFPITPRAMMAVLHDFRVVDGNIVNLSEFKEISKEQGLTEAETKAKWKQFESEVIYNYLEVDENGVRFTPGLDSKLKEDFRQGGYKQGKMERLTTMVKRAASQLDTQITSEQRVAAQRHFAMNYLMTHRGWLSIALANRTKNGHFNMSTGEFEEGSYRTFYNFVGQALPDAFKQKSLKAFKDAWNGKDLKVKEGVSVEAQLLARRRNMRRVALDSAFLAGLSGLVFALLQFADDEPDNYALQFSSYILLRVLNEQVSGQTGTAYQMYETLNAPFVGLNVVKDTFVLPYELAFGSEVVKQGRYKGETERMRALKKVIPGMKTIDDLYKLQDSRDTYYFYNKNNLRFQPISAMMVAGLED